MAAALDLNGLHEVLNLPFPANTRQAAGTINGILTDVQVISFSDRILVTISQHGRLAHWVRFSPVKLKGKQELRESAAAACAS